MKISHFLPVILLMGWLSCNFSKNDSDSAGSHEPADSLERALAELNGLIQHDRTNPDLFYRRGKIFFTLHRSDEAVDDLKVAVKIDSAQRDYHFLLADIYFSQKKPAMAKNELEKCIAINTSDKDALLKLAEIYLLMQNREKTSEVLRKVVDIDPSNPLAFYLLGIHFKETGDTNRSILSLVKAVEFNSSYYDAYLEAGIMMLHRKDYDAASYIEAALNIKPESIEAHYAAGMYYQEHNDTVKALSHYRTILMLDSGHVHTWYNIGYIHCTLGEKFSEAIPFFTRAIELNTRYAEAYYMRGLCYEAVSNKIAAKENYLKCLQYKENYELAIKGLNRMEGR